MNKHDVVLSLINLIDRPPWTRRVPRLSTALTIRDNEKAASITPEQRRAAALRRVNQNVLINGEEKQSSLETDSAVEDTEAEANDDEEDQVVRVYELEKYIDNKFMVIKDEEAPQLSKIEGQAWLATYNLLMDSHVRGIYEFTTYRKDEIVRLKRYLTETLLDQLPPLGPMRRLVEELGIAGGSSSGLFGITSGRVAIIEQVNDMRDEVLYECIRLHEQRMRRIAKDQKQGEQQVRDKGNAQGKGNDGKDEVEDDNEGKAAVDKHFLVEQITNGSGHFTLEDVFQSVAEVSRGWFVLDPNRQREEMARISRMFGDAELEALVDTPKCAVCGDEGTSRCGKCKREWYCSRACQAKGWKTHKELCKILSEPQ